MTVKYIKADFADKLEIIDRFRYSYASVCSLHSDLPVICPTLESTVRKIEMFHMTETEFFKSKDSSGSGLEWKAGYDAEKNTLWIDATKFPGTHIEHLSSEILLDVVLSLMKLGVQF